MTSRIKGHYMDINRLSADFLKTKTTIERKYNIYYEKIMINNLTKFKYYITNQTVFNNLKFNRAI